MTLRDYLNIARTWWWLVLLGAILAGAAAWALTSQMTPVYRARAVILVNQAQNPGAVTYQDILGSQQLTKTYAELTKSNINLERAADQLADPSIDVSRLERTVNAAAVADTQLIHITAEDADPEQAALVANTVAEIFPGYIEEAQLAGTSTADERALNTVFVAERASAPDNPVRPNLRLNVALGAFLGLIVMVAAVALIEYLDDGVDDREDIERLGAPFLGSIPRSTAPRGAAKDWVPSLSQDTGGPALAESYRQVYASLTFALGASDAKVILVTSAASGEGKSTTSSNLAAAVAESSKRVLLIDGDFRKPDVHNYTGVPNASGLSSTFLTDAGSAGGFLRRMSDSFAILTAGPIPPNPAELLSSKKIDGILETLCEPFDVVIIDSPPIIGLADASLWATHVDGVVLVARQGKTREGQLAEAIDAIHATHKPLIGVILNGAPQRSMNPYYRYGYGYGEKKPSKPKAPTL